MAASRIGRYGLRIGPLLVAAARPKDPTAADRLLQETLFEGKPDIERRPEFWAPYASATRNVLTRARPLSTLAARRQLSAMKLKELAARLERPLNELGFLPLIGHGRDMSMIVDLADGTPLDVLDVDPWGPAGKTSVTNQP